jgi:hypothetical protein
VERRISIADHWPKLYVEFHCIFTPLVLVIHPTLGVNAPINNVSIHRLTLDNISGSTVSRFISDFGSLPARAMAVNSGPESKPSLCFVRLAVEFEPRMDEGRDAADTGTRRWEPVAWSESDV